MKKSVFIFLACVFALASCQKDPDIPIVSLTVNDKVEAEWLEAKLSGTAVANTRMDALYVQFSLDEGFSDFTEYQTIFDENKFTIKITDLTPNTAYFYRYRGANKYGSCVDSQIRTFMTKDGIAPTVSTLDITNITKTSATCSGNVTHDGGIADTERGICYATTTDPTISNTKVVASGTGAGSFSCNLTGLTEGTTYYMRAYATNSRGTSYGEVKLFVTTKIGDGTELGHEWVDLGLSVKWATMNMGAVTVIAYGDYYAWGEISTKTDYGWSTYKYCNGTINSITKYCLSSKCGTVDKKTALEASDDVAHVYWGGKWRMPTHAEQEELYNNCTVTWTNDYQGTGVAGGIFTSKKTGYTDKSIFLPAAGYRNNESLNYAGKEGYYWSLSLYESDSNYAWRLKFDSGNVSTDNGNYRYYGRSVRAVCP